MNKFKYVGLVFLVCLFHWGYSQKPDWCGTSQAVEQAIKEDPDYAKKLEQANLFYKQYESTHYKTSSGTVYTIPIVFHVIHNYGVENISKDQILDAVRILNDDFRALNEDTADVVSSFKSIVADAEIEFKLATLDENGNCTDGITRTVSTLTFSADDNVKSLVQWDPSMYLNVWVVDEIESGAGGYSYYPGVAAWKDGIVILNRQLGSIGTSYGNDMAMGSLTHEVGHYLNLKHTWGDNNSPGSSSNCSDDDDVTDTPNCAGLTSCDLSANTCGSLDNAQNYMDYAGCMCMFTEGQKSRMRAAIVSSTGDRKNLWSTANLKATGTYSSSVIDLCTADFEYDNSYICPGSSVNFTDESWNGEPTSWSWTFNGGTPSSSTDSAPTVTYSTAGDYSVSLTVSNASGSATTTKSSIIHVSKSTPDFGPDFTDGYEDATKFSTNWDIINVDGGKTWSRTSSAAYEGSYSLKMSNYGNTQGSVDEIISPSIDLSYITSPKLKFSVAFAQQTTDNSDALKVYASTDCGKTWTLRYSKQGSSLTTKSSLVTTDYKPTSSEWEEHEISFTSSMLKENVKIKFEFTNDGGNNLYIDNLYLTGTINGIQDAPVYDAKLEVFPNPITENTVATFYLPTSSNCSLSVFDVLGRESKIIESKTLSAGEQSFSLSSFMSKPGVYILKLRVGNQEFVKTMIK